MKFPNHILLDVSKTLVSNSNQYWMVKHLTTFKNNIKMFNDFTSQQKYLLRKELVFSNKLLKNQKKFTVRYSGTNSYFFISENCKNFYTSFFKIKPKVKHRDLYSKHIGKEVFDFINKPGKKFDEKRLKRFFKNFKYRTTLNLFKTNKLWNLFDINFIKKEKIYTKLKYSRVPQYDIVSGGVAALFAGFLGFLICEKFGFELPDSGDFYFLFMYIVFLFFFLRLFLKIMNNEEFSWSIISLKWLIHFYQILMTLVFKKIFYLFSKLI